MGAVLVTQEVNDAMKPGDHGSTFAGNPLVCAAANVVIDRLEQPGFLEQVMSKGELLKSLLTEKVGSNKHVVEVRGAGLLVGVQLDTAAGPLVDACRDAGLLVISAGKGDVLRLVPPLIITEDEIARAVDIIAANMSVLD
eukprot:scaffold1909_cov353-Prasinococcus_capsulatus_cf.AAC.2